MANPSVKGKSATQAMLDEGTMVGAYEILRRVGVGGMGEVYRARHVGLNKVVALKLLSADVQDEDARARFLREGKLASKIQHPHIVDVTDVGEHLGTPYLVMEYLEGEPLSKLLKRMKRLPSAPAVDVMVPTFAAIAAAHAMGVVHRDIKPDNIFMTQSGLGEVVPKVLDFGISKAVEDTAPAITVTHAFVGTPHYMSPEQAQGAKRATKLSDQYSLAVVLYEVLSGVRPFDEPSFLKLVHSIARGRAVPLRHVRPEVSEGLANIVARGMQLDAEARFPSVRDMALAMLPYGSDRTRTLWQPRLEGLAAPASQVLASPDTGAGLISHSGPIGAETRSEGSRSGQVPAAAQSHPGQAPPVGYPSNPGHSHGGGHTGASQSHPSAASASYAGVPSYTGAPSYSGAPSYGGPLADSGVHASRAGLPLDTQDDTVMAATGTARTTLRTTSKRRNSWIAVGALALLAGGGLAAVYLIAPAAGGPATAPSGMGTTQTYRVEVAAEPSNATLKLDGEEVGTGRFVGELPRDGSLHRLVVSAEGYESQTLGFKDVPPQKKVTLKAKPSATPDSTATTVPVQPRPWAVRPPSNGANTAAASATTAPTAPNPAPTPISTSTTGNIDPWQEK